MAIKFVSSGGRVLIGSSSASVTSYYDGTCAESTSLRKRINTNSAQCMESEFPEENITTVQYEVSLTAFFQADGTDGLFAIPSSKIYGVYLSPTGTTLFAGTCIAVDTGDDQKGQSAAQQTITLRSSGQPTVG